MCRGKIGESTMDRKKASLNLIHKFQQSAGATENFNHLLGIPIFSVSFAD